jgi:hypothetical protein
MTDGVRHPLVGTWTLVTVCFEFVDTGEVADLYGDRPTGRLILTRKGQLSVMITAGDRKRTEGRADDAALFRSMMAYSGAYRIELDVLTTEVDLAWEPGWVGTHQVRHFKLDGDNLALTTAPQTHPMFPDRPGRGILLWRRA